MIDESKDATLDRRSLLRSAGGAALGLGALGILIGCGGDGDNPPSTTGSTNGNTNGGQTNGGQTNGGTTGGGTGAVTDADVLNFALNLEYLEAEYYLRALTGNGLSNTDAGTTSDNVTGGKKVNFSNDALGDLATELAKDELDHVRFLRGALKGRAVARPTINFTDAFNAAAQAAGLGNSFDPFANETNFLLGAFVFEDVGVTAYTGGSTLLKSKANLVYAAQILAVEAYHAGAVRTLINKAGGQAIQIAAALSDLRDGADGSEDKDQPVTLNGRANYVPTDDNSLTFPRTTGEVIKIVTLGAANNRGGFFPNGLNGDVK